MSELALLEPKAAEVPQPPPKAQKAEKTPPRYEQVETGIYRYKAADGSVTYHERPTIDGTRTYRSLGVNFAPQSSLKNAKDEFHRRRSEIAAGRNPYAPTVPEGKARIRLMLTSEHTRAQLDQALETLERVAKRLGILG